MGLRGPGARSRKQFEELGIYFRHYTGEHYWELLWGPKLDESSPDYDRMIELLIAEWEKRGGREEFGQAYYRNVRRPGTRAWAFWQFELTDAQTEKAMECRCQAEAILKLKLADAIERKAIRAQGIIAKQIAELEERKVA